MLDLAFAPDRSSSEPLYRQLEEYLRELIKARRLAPADRLPASRELAAALGLARNTVNQAYQTLTDQGLLHAHVGQGTFVAAPPPGVRPEPEDGSQAGAPGTGRAFAWGGLLARRTRGLELPAAFRGEPGPVEFDFRGGLTDIQSLSSGELRRVYGHAVDSLHELADHRDPRGWPPLREAVARSLLSRGIRCGADDIAIVNGAQQALDLVARVLVDPGDTVVLEQPGYFGAAAAFSAAEAHLVGVGVDEHGMRTDELARLLRARRVKLVFSTPAVQCPTGVSLSETRRRELLGLTDEYQVPLVEDDYDSELRYGTPPPPPALKNMDEAGQVIYVGTFSKALFAGVRVGYVVAPQPLLWRLVLSRFATDFQTDLIVQAALAELLEGGGLERHVRRVRRLYAARRHAMLSALVSEMPEGAQWTEPRGGNAVWVTLPLAVDGELLLPRARENGITYTRGDAFYFDGSGMESLNLSFARLDEDHISRGIARLSELIRETTTKRGHRR